MPRSPRAVARLSSLPRWLLAAALLTVACGDDDDTAGEEAGTSATPGGQSGASLAGSAGAGGTDAKAGSGGAKAGGASGGSGSAGAGAKGGAAGSAGQAGAAGSAGGAPFGGGGSQGGGSGGGGQGGGSSGGSQGGGGQGGGSGGGASGAGGKPGSGTCASPIDITAAIAANGVFSGQIKGPASSDHSVQCGTLQGSVTVLRWDIPEAGNYRLTAEATSGQLLNGPSLIVRTDCADSTREVTCDQQHDHKAFFGLPAATTLFIQVRAEQVPTSFTLTIQEAGPCSDSTDCPAFTAGCIEGICADCVAGTGCGSKLCDTTIGHCTGCHSDADCAALPGNTHCTQWQECMGCTADAECAQDSRGHVCQASNHYCGCDSGADCAAGDQCINGSCATCDQGSVDCDGNAFNACEVHPPDNPNACGDCTTSCHGGGCNQGLCSPAGEVLLTGTPGALDNDESNLYVDNGGALTRLPKSGGPATVLATAQGTIARIAHDSTHLYWLSHDSKSATPDSLRRMAKTGGAVEQLDSIKLPSSSGAALHDLALDATDIYYGHGGDFYGTILRMPKAGGPSAVFYTSSFTSGDFSLGGDSVFYWYWSEAFRIPKQGSKDSTELPIHHNDVLSDETRLFDSKDGVIYRHEFDGSGSTQLGALPGWYIHPARLDDADIVLTSTGGPAGSALDPKGGATKEFLFVMPKTGGTPKMIGSTTGSFGRLTSDTTHVYVSDQGKLRRFAK